MVAYADVRALALAYGDMLSADDHEHVIELWNGRTTLADDPRQAHREAILQSELRLLDRMRKRGLLAE